MVLRPGQKPLRQAAGRKGAGVRALIAPLASDEGTFEVIQNFGVSWVMSVTEEIQYSQLVQHPKDTMAKLEESPRRRIPPRPTRR